MNCFSKIISQNSLFWKMCFKKRSEAMFYTSMQDTLQSSSRKGLPGFVWGRGRYAARTFESSFLWKKNTKRTKKQVNTRSSNRRTSRPSLLVDQQVGIWLTPHHNLLSCPRTHVQSLPSVHMKIFADGSLIWALLVTSVTAARPPCCSIEVDCGPLKVPV